MTDSKSKTSSEAHHYPEEQEELISSFFSEQGEFVPDENFRAGYVSIVGRPNVGKSTLMNHLIGQKVSITSRKPQTTRHKIVGIDTRPEAQVVYVDTPGMHRKEPRAINRSMNQAANSALRDVSVVVFVVDAMKWTDDDELVLSKLKQLDVPIILALNKVDTISEKSALLPYLSSLQQKHSFAEIIPVSALRNQYLENLYKAIVSHLPLNEPFYAPDQLTDRSERFIASEMIREKIMRQLGDELPYDLTVQIDAFKNEDAYTDKKGKLRPACRYIDATIFVARPGQKAIVIGDGGQKLKSIGTQAREDMEAMFSQKVMLTLWVKVKDGWSDDERALKSLGYGDI